MAASNGDLGVSSGQMSKSDAVKDSLAKCAKYGATDCVVHLAIKNQCLAIASASGVPQTMFGSGASKERASDVAVKACESKSGATCKVAYSGCTEPVFESF